MNLNKPGTGKQLVDKVVIRKTANIKADQFKLRKGKSNDKKERHI